MLKHRGEILSRVIREKNAKIAPLAKKMGIDRGTVYRHMDDPELSLDYITQYGKALDYDFSKDFPEMLYVLREPPAEYGSAKSYDELKDAADYWKDKYIDILEKYNALLLSRGNGDNGKTTFSGHGS
ncbi:MAG TPA: hypothetical protein VNQ80_12430 [Parapedobacter sp.]|uniref:hypothetical protein n=1 Tax=Parapedobacter sp. TaxID=1958893 RepID=UPI002B599D57|nr:hypothetical protein [Parapedobacter sp.]HWK58144.1 hypothetical protein [Parapedobacter sp.]